MSDETAVIEIQASVYNYDLSISNWAPSDAGSSRLFLFHTPSSGAYRVIAQSLPDQNFVVNSSCHAGMKPQKLSDTFFQFKDISGTIYGVNAGSATDAAGFLNLLTNVVDGINAPASTPDPSASSAPSSGSGMHPRVKGLADHGSTHSSPLVSSSAAELGGHGSALKSTNSSVGSAKAARVRSATTRESRAPRLASASQSSYIPASSKQNYTTIKKSTTPRARSAEDLGLLKRDATLLSARENIVKEIYTSEASYVKSLNQLVEGCLRPVKGKKGVFSSSEIKTIFSNIEVIRNFNNELMESIRVRLKGWDDESTQIGDLFLAKIPFLKLYNTYCNNYETAAKLLEKIGSRKNVREYLKNVESECGMGLNFLLIMPVQRVPRYKMLFEDLLKHTDSGHPDSSALRDATVKIKEIANEINQSVLRTQSNETVSKLKKKVSGLDKLTKPGRSLLKEGACSVKMGEKTFTHLFLFTDLVALGSPSADKKKRIQLTQQLKLAHTWVDNLRDSKSAFQLLTPDNSYLVTCPKSNDKEVWVEVLNKAVTAYLSTTSDVVVESDGSRKFALSLANGDVYQGRWVNAKRDGQGTQKYNASANVYQGEWQEGFFHGQGTMKYKCDTSYAGAWEKGKPHGVGKMTSPSYTYEGEWHKGAPQGAGKMAWTSGSIYEGAFEAGLPSGEGTFTGVDGTTYVGAWRRGKFHGRGHMTSTVGTYEGEFSEGMRHGTGTIAYSNGDRYEGEWQSGLPYGRGEWTSADGKGSYKGGFVAGRKHGQDCVMDEPNYHYEGEFKNGFPCGSGTLVDSIGEYKGEFLNGKKQGRGTMTYRDGSTFDGDWKEDRRDGKGTQIGIDGSRYDGQWNNDRQEGTGVMRYPNGAVYSGKWKLGRRSGQGVYQTKGETHKYVGDWVANQRQGKGTLSSALGTYEGDFQNDVKHGTGEFKYADGRVYRGAWEDGSRHGAGTMSYGDGSSVEQRYDHGVLVMPLWTECAPMLPDPLVVMRH